MLSNGYFSLSDLSGLAFSLHINGLFSGVQLDVSLGRKVRANATVGSVGTTTSLGSSIDLNVINGKILEVLGVGVSLEVVD